LVEKRPGPTEEELLALLLERKVLSSAQVEVAKIDSASSGLSYADVLLARKWITEEDLDEFYPAATSAVNSAASQPKALEATPGKAKDGERSDASYQDNLQKYKQLMTKIMGGYY
jgi:hypothetical protein